MKKLSKLIYLLFLTLLSNTAISAPAAFEGEFIFYDASRLAVLNGGYTGEIDLANETGTMYSTENFNGVPWNANVAKMFVYDETVGGSQQFSWDVVQQIWYDLTNSQLIECYVDTNGCANVSPGSLLLGERTFSHPFTLTQPGQFAIGTFVNWSINVIPNLLTLQSVSGSLGSGSTVFESFDGDSDGAPGYAMVANPFPSQTFAFSGFIGSQDGIFVSDIVAVGGALHECTSVSGDMVSVSVDVSVTNDAVDTVNWMLNGSMIGSGTALDVVMPLGVNELTVVATAVSGLSATSQVTITVEDTAAPEVVVEFIDTQFDTAVSVINRNGLTRIKANYTATDVCDASPTITATGGFNIINDSFLPVKVLNDEIIIDIPEMKISATAMDSSNNSSSASASLFVQ